MIASLLDTPPFLVTQIHHFYCILFYFCKARLAQILILCTFNLFHVTSKIRTVLMFVNANSKTN